MEFAIRAATKGDLDALSEIIEDVDALHRQQMPHVFQRPHGPPREREYMLAMLRDELYSLFVAHAGGKILGFVQTAIRDAPSIPILVPRRVAVVENLAVRREHRRAGIGHALMRQAECWAKELGATEIELNVYEFNQDAVAFYRSLGYTTFSRRMGRRLS